ncbi:glycosyltransferase family 39 protein [Solirubrobacter sp. CPCC 204708]|uniref:Glycosyltransferase family 39 protein n=1 Tax=Solirubrobacter deserti TaxID=2282478 RepID=A0ABT4RPJ9_9ACTN|nr:glycosyltransferase family 39 protein [Solirubrobacter deserti]MBE2319908.1 glycosyltransferase family 39 protein [Solirubrobacter deserti]MDA0140498.1 glycosyltransferase family 39 protein [Solirubrobacter deserti]
MNRVERQPVLWAAALAALMGVSLLLRTSALDASYWIDEGIAVGIASHDLRDIPGALGQDGNPPLYYLLLHGWMVLFGTTEAATRALSLVFALAAIPASFWAGTRVFTRRAGVLAAAGAAGAPFLTYYAQETRMYSLVVLLSILASASFALAFVRGERRHVAWLGVWLALLLYTHTWALFLVTAMGAVWLHLWRRREVEPRDGVRLAILLAVAYLPWLPVVLFQAEHTAAPWAERPSPLLLLIIPGGLFGHVALPLLAIAVFFAVRRLPPVDRAVRMLLGVAIGTALLAWLASQVEPAWATRYSAVLMGPLLLALASVVARGPRWTVLALVGVAGVWAVSGPSGAKSNVRTVSTTISPSIRPGDLVVSTQPEQVPALHRYLPGGVVYLTPMGLVQDPRQTDWRDGLARLRGGQALTELLPVIKRLDPGQRVLIVTPEAGGRLSQSPWARAVRIRTREWRAALDASARLQPIGGVTTFPSGKNVVRARLYEVRR